jgi:hypothetical protein
LKFLSAWKGPSKEFNDICDSLCTHVPIASGTAKSYKESYVTCNAIADCAKAREVDEKTLLENRGQRIVEVGSFCEAPQFFGDLRSLRCETEEIGKDSESLGYAILKV